MNITDEMSNGIQDEVRKSLRALVCGMFHASHQIPARDMLLESEAFHRGVMETTNNIVLRLRACAPDAGSDEH